MVLDNKNEAKKITDFLELKWEDSMTDFHENKRRVITISSSQVRKKAYTSSINKWKNYSNQLKTIQQIIVQNLN